MKNKINQLQEVIKGAGYYGYLIPSSDEYMSEYTPHHAKRLEYITNFTGSNGLALVTLGQGIFFTDGRYIQQSKKEVDIEQFSLQDIAMLDNFTWENFLPEDAIIAYDPKLFTRNFRQKFSKLKLTAHQCNLVDEIWHNRPSALETRIYDCPVENSGLIRAQNISMAQDFIKQHDAKALLITDPDSVCWLLSLRASDVECSPLLLAHALVTLDVVYLFTNSNRMDFSCNKILCSEDLPEALRSQAGKILFDPKQSSEYICELVEQYPHQHVTNPCLLKKACKTTAEIDYARAAHREDAKAVREIIRLAKSGYFAGKTEYDVGVKLKQLRALGGGYFYDSFPAICGFAENSAIIHYRAPENGSKIIGSEGVLLIDSGGQYIGATTDITRTIYVGYTPPARLIDLYTRVLKGHIAIASLRFPKGKVTGAHIDAMARRYLWEIMLDYPHGTGHGVGAFLSVHEGPQNISPLSTNTILQPGMIVSNEPGCYLPGEFGIRIENLLCIRECAENADFLEFEDLTMVPYETDLINFDLLSKEEIDFVKKQHI